MTSLIPISRSIPEGMDVETFPDRIVISKKWYQPFLWLALPFVIPVLIVWNCITLSWYVGCFLNIGTLGIAIIFPLVFMSVHLMLGLFVTYAFISTFFNTTKLTLRNEGVELTVSPFWWPGQQRVSRADLRGFFVRINEAGPKRRRSYRVVLVNGKNREQTLYNGIMAQEQAEYVCSCLQNYYGVK